MDDDTPNLLRSYTSTIVTAYLKRNTDKNVDVSALIEMVHQTLSDLGKPQETQVPRPEIPVVPIRRSVLPGYIVCLDCGFRGMMLKRHLRSVHHLSPEDYRKRWALPSTYPMTAPNYSSKRSNFAKESGLGVRHRVNGSVLLK